MTDETIPQTVLFPDLFDRPLIATFDQAQASSDGGAVLLKAADARLGLIDAFTDCVTDGRTATRVAHTLRELIAQRVFGIACGYPDANDADRLADDPMQKLLLDRDPIDGPALASQPTISRFENGVLRTELYEMGFALAQRVVDRHRRRLHGRARRITIDLDPTDDPTHGAQQLALFNGHYDTWCYLPVLAFVTFNQEPEQYLCAAVLRSGTAPATQGALGILRRLVPLLRTAFPGPG
ncbi:MAG: transposase [Acidobacteria bacterium]|nr:transposase [Acidobacteriota bacterium]